MAIARRADAPYWEAARQGTPSLAALAPTAEERAWWRRARIGHAARLALPAQVVLFVGGVGARVLEHGADAFAGASGLRWLALMLVFMPLAAAAQWALADRTQFAKHLAGRRLRQALDAELAAGPRADEPQATGAVR